MQIILMRISHATGYVGYREFFDNQNDYIKSRIAWDRMMSHILCILGSVKSSQFLSHVSDFVNPFPCTEIGDIFCVAG